MKKVWLLVTVFVTLILFFPIANLAFNRSPQVIEGSLQKIEEKVSMLDTQLKNIEKNTLETYTYITEKQKQLAEKAGTSVELIRTLQNIAASYNIPLELAYEVVRLESNFDPKLTCYNEWNDTYDRGLFQLNDNTSPWLAEKIGIKDFTYDMAYNIELNMKMGLW
ncbi:MAG: soluble lytic murein transglycosylase, partial [Clostridia bacterium]|nr:soluble lytic murein transglycosylase [Clostridia bacterium]